MSDDNPSQSDGSNSQRRASFTSNTFTALFGRNNSTSGPSNTTGVAAQPAPVSTATVPGRRLSITTLGLTGTSPMQTPGFGLPSGRRGSVSTAGSDSIDENAIDDDDGPGPTRSVPTTPFARRMSFGAQAPFNARANGTPATNGRRTPPSTTSPLSRTDEGASRSKKSPSTQASTQSQSRTSSDYSSTRSAEGLNWSEQFRSRAESAVQKPPLTNMTPRTPSSPSHERAKSFSHMPDPPTASIPAVQPQ